MLTKPSTIPFLNNIFMKTQHTVYYIPYCTVPLKSNNLLFRELLQISRWNERGIMYDPNNIHTCLYAPQNILDSIMMRSILRRHSPALKIDNFYFWKFYIVHLQILMFFKNSEYFVLSVYRKQKVFNNLWNFTTLLLLNVIRWRTETVRRISIFL